MNKLIYIKLDYEEAINAKKDMLYSEENILRIIKTIRQYNLLRSAELKLKLKMQKEMKIIMNNIRILEKTLPKVEIPDITHPDKNFEDDEASEIQENKALEKQLEDIQKRLMQFEEHSE